MFVGFRPGGSATQAANQTHGLKSAQIPTDFRRHEATERLVLPISVAQKVRSRFVCEKTEICSGTRLHV